MHGFILRETAIHRSAVFESLSCWLVGFAGLLAWLALLACWPSFPRAPAASFTRGSIQCFSVQYYSGCLKDLEDGQPLRLLTASLSSWAAAGWRRRGHCRALRAMSEQATTTSESDREYLPHDAPSPPHPAPSRGQTLPGSRSEGGSTEYMGVSTYFVRVMIMKCHSELFCFTKRYGFGCNLCSPPNDKFHPNIQIRIIVVRSLSDGQCKSRRAREHGRLPRALG